MTAAQDQGFSCSLCKANLCLSVWPLIAKIGLILFEQTRDPAPSWFVLSEAFGFVLPLCIVALVFATVYEWQEWLSEWLSPSDLKTNRCARRLLEDRAKPRLARGLRRYARGWLILVLFLNFAAVCGAFIWAGGPLAGFWQASRIYILFNVLNVCHQYRTNRAGAGCLPLGSKNRSAAFSASAGEIGRREQMVLIVPSRIATIYASGISERDIAQRYGWSQSAVHRRRSRRVPGDGQIPVPIRRASRSAVIFAGNG